jgi:ABC-2 type transport system ATP-binding protein
MLQPIYAVDCVGATKRFRAEEKSSFKNFFSPKYVTAVDNVSISVERGEIFGIIGPNGSGKSTLIRMIATLLLPDGGDVKVFGRDVVKNTFDVRKMINRVSVDASFFKKLSVWENLSYAARLYEVPIEKAKAVAKTTLKTFGLKEEKMNHPVEDLSRGQQQMVSIARSLLSSPNLLLLDEPTTGLDPQSKLMVQNFILGVSNSSDTTIILTSHDMNEVEKLCKKLAFIKDGKIWACSTAEEMKRLAGKHSLEEVFFHLTGEEFPNEDKNRDDE